jgi:hypothetical protein
MKKLILFLFSLLIAHDSPYSLDKFKPILNEVKLQAPTSKYNPLYSVKYGQFDSYSNKYFYLQDNDLMVFYMCDKHNRSELRFKNDWYVDNNKEKIFFTDLKIIPLNSKEFTFLQIHSDNNLFDVNKPLLRIAFIKNKSEIKDFIWAVIRVSPYENDYKKVLLGKDYGFMKIKIFIKDEKLYISYNGVMKINGFDIKKWKKIPLYFKLGVYLQSEGCAKALFKDIKLKDY